MLIHMVAIVFLFLARMRSPKSKSVHEVIRSRCSKITVERVFRLEKLDYRLRKAELNLPFSYKCDHSNVIQILQISICQIVILNIYLSTCYFNQNC